MNGINVKDFAAGMAEARALLAGIDKLLGSKRFVDILESRSLTMRDKSRFEDLVEGVDQAATLAAVLKEKLAAAVTAGAEGIDQLVNFDIEAEDD